MKRNNKLTRKRAAKLAAQTNVAGQLLDGTEVLKTKESRTKQRRWSFEADVALVFDAPKNDDGTTKLGEDEQPLQATEMPPRALKLNATSYSTAKEAIEDCKTHEGYLRATSPLFAKAKIKVRAIPHETVSKATLNQLSGYRDMAMILDKALAMAIEEAEHVVFGRSIGAQFVLKDAVPAEGDTPLVPARTAASIKEEFYKKALATFREEPKAEMPTESTLVLTEGNTEERKPFVPEIVNPDSVLV